MAIRKPLVVISGQIQELPASDSIDANVAQAVPDVYEPIVVASFNTDVLYDTNTYLVPMFLTTVDGDIILGVV